MKHLKLALLIAIVLLSSCNKSHNKKVVSIFDELSIKSDSIEILKSKIIDLESDLIELQTSNNQKDVRIETLRETIDLSIKGLEDAKFIINHYKRMELNRQNN